MLEKYQNGKLDIEGQGWGIIGFILIITGLIGALINEAIHVFGV